LHCRAGKAGGFLALEWQDGSGTGPLARRSFQLHSELAAELGADTGYRRVRTLAVTCSAQAGMLQLQWRFKGC
jgi:glycine/D-amino acid oxidase-like deaminating enzyme